jgi:hypothetical protein
MTGQRPKRHHFVAQFHLAGFAEPQVDRRTEIVWLADVKERTVRRTTPRNVALERLFYEWRDASWWKESSEPPQLERFFSEVEGRAAPVFQRFAAIDFTRLALTDEDRYHVSNYIGLQLTRTPLALEVVGAAEKTVVDSKIQQLADDPAFDEKYRRFVAAHSDGAPLPSADAARARIKTDPPRLVLSRDRSLGLSVMAGFEVGARLFEMPWCCLVAPNNLFFASDHPVFMHSDNGKPETIEISLALSSRVRLVAHAKPRPTGRGNIIHVTDRGAEACNRVVLQAVHRFFFCPTQALAEWTVANYADADTASVMDALDALDAQS